VQRADQGGFSYFDHTADVGLEAHDATYAGLVRQALLGAASLVVPASEVERRTSHQVAVEADDEIGALVQAVNELLYLLDSEGFLLAEAEVGVDPGAGARPVRLHLRLTGDLLSSPERAYVAERDVKAATYSGAAVEHPKSGLWRARLVLDV
jgi:SHS2 domain-containing protein